MLLHQTPTQCEWGPHYSDIIMSMMASQITGISTVCSTVCSGADQRNLQSSTSRAFVRGIIQWPVHSPHKGPVMRKMFPFYDVMKFGQHCVCHNHSDESKATYDFCKFLCYLMILNMSFQIRNHINQLKMIDNIGLLDQYKIIFLCKMVSSHPNLHFRHTIKSLI